MKTIVRQEDIVPSDRFFYASLIILVVSSILMLRLWYLQIYKGQYYIDVAERNRIRRIEIPAPRGLIYDRHGQVILSNYTSYDLVMVPQYVTERDMTFKLLSRLLHIPESELERSVRVGAGRPRYLPLTLKRNLSLHEVSTIENNKIFLPGIEVRTAPRRDYTAETPPHLLGYLGEIDQTTLDSINQQTKQKYFPGDLIGKQGLESRFEQNLRGKNGYRLIQVDAFGRQVDAAKDVDFDLPTSSASKGDDVELTIDLDLQKATRDAFKGKYGAVIVLNPKTGEILSMLSEPGYDPSIYQRSVSTEEWNALVNNPFKPLFDKTTGGEYIPGSIYKAVVAMAALEEGVIDINTTYSCNGRYTIGNQTFHCWEKGGHGIVNVAKAIIKSCDVFFYHVGVELGVDRVAKYAKAFGLGSKLGVALNLERPGLIPTAAWKKQTFGLPWTGGDTPNIAIGQGYNLLTPIQMASLYGSIANGGKIWRPYLVRRIVNPMGGTIEQYDPQLLAEVKIVKPENMALVREFLRGVVMDVGGTGRNAAVEGVTVAGKTGSAQVVSLKKNSNNKNDDVSVKWKEHAIFAAFSPAEDAEVAIAIVSENDAIGGGGAQAAPIAGKILKAYWEQKKRRETRQLDMSRSTGDDRVKN